MDVTTRYAKYGKRDFGTGGRSSKAQAGRFLLLRRLPLLAAAMLKHRWAWIPSCLECRTMFGEKIIPDASPHFYNVSGVNKDRLTKEHRSWVMSRIRGKDT